MSSEPIVPNSTSRKKTLLRAARSYREQLDDRTRAYLHSRGFDDGVIARFGFGLAAEPMPEHSPARGMLSIPYIVPGNGVKAIRFRCVADDHDCKDQGHPKYWGESGSRTGLFNTRDLTAASDTLAMCEGELDAATLSGANILPAVAAPGANAWRPFFGRMMAGFTRVVLFADGDTAGEKLVHDFRRALPSVGIVKICKQGDDINSLFVREGKEGITNMLKEDDE